MDTCGPVVLSSARHRSPTHLVTINCATVLWGWRRRYPPPAVPHPPSCPPEKVIPTQHAYLDKVGTPLSCRPPYGGIRPTLSRWVGSSPTSLTGTKIPTITPPSISGPRSGHTHRLFTAPFSVLPTSVFTFTGCWPLLDSHCPPPVICLK